MRVMMIGLGRMGLAHSAILRQMPGVEIVALVDKDAGLGRMALSMGLVAPFYEDVNTALDRERPTVAYLCAPTFAHLPIVEQLAPVGIDVFIEKPMGHSLAASEEIARLLASPDRITALGYNLSGERTFQKARWLMRRGVIGSVRRYEASALHGEVFKARSGWLFDPTLSGGGALSNIGTHMLYYIMSCFGPPQRVSAVCRSLYSPQVEDEAKAELVHKQDHDSGGGKKFVVNYLSTGARQKSRFWSFLSRPKAPAASSKWDVPQSNLILIEPAPGFAAGKHIIHCADIPTESIYNFSPDYGGDGYCVESLRFIQSCRERRPYEIDARFGLAIDQLRSALYESSNQGGAELTPEIAQWAATDYSIVTEKGEE